MAQQTDLRELLGSIDIYLFDQLLKGRMRPGMRILDAGCGTGRNAYWFLREGFDVHAVDQDPESVEETRALMKRLAPALDEENAQVARVESLPFLDGVFDFVICNAVLHFACNEKAFHTMLSELWRVLAPGGILFTRLASSEGLQGRVVHRGDGRYQLPDGSERFLIDDETLLRLGAELGGDLLEPIKTTNVQGLRCMSTWVLGKSVEGQR